MHVAVVGGAWVVSCRDECLVIWLDLIGGQLIDSGASCIFGARERVMWQCITFWKALNDP